MVCYDAAKDGLFEAFLAAAGLEPAPDLTDVPRVQVAMDTLQLAYLMGLPPDMPYPAFLERRAACEAVARRDALSCRTSLLGVAELGEISARYRPSNRRLLERLDQTELEPVLQPRTPAAAEAPLQDLLATDAYRRFHAEVDAIALGSRHAEPAALRA